MLPYLLRMPNYQWVFLPTYPSVGFANAFHHQRFALYCLNNNDNNEVIIIKSQPNTQKENLVGDTLECKQWIVVCMCTCNTINKCNYLLA